MPFCSPCDLRINLLILLWLMWHTIVRSKHELTSFANIHCILFSVGKSWRRQSCYHNAYHCTGQTLLVSIQLDKNITENRSHQSSHSSFFKTDRNPRPWPYRVHHPHPTARMPHIRVVSALQHVKSARCFILVFCITWIFDCSSFSG